MLARNKGVLKIYKSYNFVDKDPVIDYTRTKVYANGGPSKISKESGVTPTTLYNWYKGKTRRPQFSTVAAVLIACGEHMVDLRKVQRSGK